MPPKTSLILLLILLMGCQSISKEIDIQPRVKFNQNPISNFLNTISPSSETHSIVPNRDTVIFTNNHTSIFIPQNSFIRADNNMAEGVIQLEILEALTLNDMILHDLKTTSKQGFLESDGMLFIDATHSEYPVILAPEKEIYIDLKTEFKKDRMQLYQGIVSDSSMIWSNNKKLVTNYLISVPLNLLNFNICGFECGFNETQIKSLKSEIFQGTYISTREFEERACALAYLTCDHLGNIDEEILKIYKDNISHNLNHADSLCINLIKFKYSDILIDNFDPNSFEFTKSGWINYTYYLFNIFKDQNAPNTLNLDNITELSRSALSKLGYSAKDIDVIIAHEAISKEIIQQRKDSIQVQNISSYSFGITDLGWINVDRLLYDPATQESNFKVIVNSSIELKSIQVSLAIPKRNVLLPSSKISMDTYRFTNDTDGYKQLPVGEPAYIVAIGILNNMIYFAMKEITIPRNGEIRISPLESSNEEIEKLIQNLSL